MRGPDAAVFLQDLVTNDVESIKPGEAMFAGLLTPQGKILCDFLIYMREPQSYWLDCMRDQAEAIAKRLSMYKLRAKAEIADRSAELAVGAAWGETPGEGDGAFLASYDDPRYAPLGARFVIASSASEPPSLAAAATSATAYHSHRISLAVPQGGLDYAYGDAFPHEACFDELHGVDFDKGCYVGQEVVSRMHHRGLAKTRIAAIEASAPLDAVGAEIRAGEFPVGTLGSTDGTQRHSVASPRPGRRSDPPRYSLARGRNGHHRADAALGQLFRALREGRDLIVTRCGWVSEEPIYVAYHDEEWGVPNGDSRALFEKVILEGFQAGLSWITILRKREHFRRVFDNFEAQTRSRATGREKKAALLADPGIIRNRLKVDAAIDNARAYLALSEKQSLASLLLGFCRWQADPEPVHRSVRGAAGNASQPRHLKGAEGARIPLRRSDDDLCDDAVRRDRQRPHDKLSPA